eukprot:13663672-Ditylum_brightwellii.AAC.1
MATGGKDAPNCISHLSLVEKDKQFDLIRRKELLRKLPAVKTLRLKRPPSPVKPKREKETPTAIVPNNEDEVIVPLTDVTTKEHTT